MTLILTVANSSGVYQSSDYRLTDRQTGEPVPDKAGHKQLQASFTGFDLRLAFTGIAAVGTGQRTIDWLLGELKSLPHDSKLEDICDALARRSSVIALPHGSKGILELVLTVAAVGEPFRVAVISNVDWRKHPPAAKPQFRIGVHTITKPFHLVSGYRDSLPASQRDRLRAIAKDIGKEPSDVLAALGQINAIAAQRSQGYVSEDCWVTSQTADGRVRRSAGLNVGERAGDIPIIFGGGEMFELVRKNFGPALGQNIRLVQSAGAMYGPGDGTPLPLPSGEPRRFALGGSAITASLRSSAGEECAGITIAQRNCVLQMRCNEKVRVPFATLTFTGMSPLGGAFPKPFLPWPRIVTCLTIDDGSVPQGFEYPVGYWIENGAHHVIIPASSHPIRNVAFLGAEDEMVIVAPSSTMEFAWSPDQEAPSALLEASVWWRSRLHGAHA